jgi:hypothetical protein
MGSLHGNRLHVPSELPIFRWFLLLAFPEQKEELPFWERRMVADELAFRMRRHHGRPTTAGPGAALTSADSRSGIADGSGMNAAASRAARSGGGRRNTFWLTILDAMATVSGLCDNTFDRRRS